MQYKENLDGISPENLHGFFAGWPNPPSPDTHLRILQQSSHVVLARESSGRVVGFITVLSDGVLSAYISLLEVLPSHQRRGIGTELVRRVVSRLGTLYSVTVQCDQELQPFYESLGLRPLSGMAIRDYSAQAGKHVA